MLKRWSNGGRLLWLLVAGCGGGLAATSAPPASKGADATAGVAATMGGASTEASSGLLGRPPSPPRSGVQQPGASSASPNLRVSPWAGFRSAITYTFDDSQPSQLEHWPELQATGVNMTFFVNPSGHSRAGYDASWAAIAAAGSEIGNHTFSHCHANLADCAPVGSAEAEIDQATDYITSHLAVQAVYSFASPFGDTGWDSFARARFLTGRGVMSGTVPAWGQTDWYDLPVFAVAAGQVAADFTASIDSARAQGRWGIFLFHSILPSANNWFAGVQIADITASIAYARALGDVWLASMAEIGAYARAQQLFESLVPNKNTWTWALPAHFPPGKVLRVIVDGGHLSQGATPLVWDPHGYYEVSLDVGALTWTP